MPTDTSYHGGLGDHFVQLSSRHPTNMYIDRPAMLALIGDVAGLDVLDVGCGAGFYSAALVGRGAEVTGIDGSEELLRYAEEAAGSRATFRHHDLEEPLPFTDASFDLAVMALVYHHVYNRRQLLAELRRVLRPTARLLVSTTHPAGEQRWLGGSYYEGGRVDAPVGERFRINFERMTIERFVNELLDGGFVLERLLEPRPDAALRALDPAEFERLDSRANVLTVAMRRPASEG
ncbi:MAG: class I SAM-dependent methyltransferase [Catenulispora sp.]